MTDCQRRLLELQSEAEALADKADLTKTDMDRIVDIKREQETLSADLTDAEKLELSGIWLEWTKSHGEQEAKHVN